MPWNKKSGGGRWQNGGQGPWGQQPSGGGSGGSGGGQGGGGQPPDLDELFKRSQDRLRGAMPGGIGGGFMALFIVAGLVVLWGLSGIYQVGPDQRGVVLRFGEAAYTTEPGLHWHIPWPVEEALTPAVTKVFCYDLGVASGTQGCQSFPTPTEDRLMLTSDRNFLDVGYSVYWQINPENVEDFLFNVALQESSVVAVAQSAMREVVGRGEFDSLQTEQRAATELEVRELMQTTLDSYGAGISVTDIKLQRVDPPAEALEAARKVETAKQDKEKLRNQAEAYQNRVIPEARGEAERLVQEAQAYKQRVIADAQGESARFLSVYDQYRLAPDVTRKRMHLETMERLFADTNKVIVDQTGGGVVPYLPLPELQKRAQGGQ